MGAFDGLKLPFVQDNPAPADEVYFPAIPSITLTTKFGFSELAAAATSAREASQKFVYVPHKDKSYSATPIPVWYAEHLVTMQEGR